MGFYIFVNRRVLALRNIELDITEGVAFQLIEGGVDLEGESL